MASLEGRTPSFSRPPPPPGHHGQGFGQQSNLGRNPRGKRNRILRRNRQELRHASALGQVDANHLLVEEGGISLIGVRGRMGDDIVNGHGVSEFGRTDSVTQGDHFAGSLVPHDHAGSPAAALAGEAMDVAAADADRLHLDQDLSRRRFGLGQSLQPHFPRCMKHNGLHGLRHRHPQQLNGLEPIV